MILRVLIPTLESRPDQFQYMWERLAAQIRTAGAEGAMEVLYDRDKRERSLGAKP